MNDWCLVLGNSLYLVLLAVCDLTATVTVQTVLLTTSTICKMPVLVLMWDPFQNFNLSLSPLFSYAKKFMFLKRLTLKTAKISCFSRLR